jgi:hypothetical protein
MRKAVASQFPISRANQDLAKNQTGMREGPVESEALPPIAIHRHKE